MKFTKFWGEVKNGTSLDLGISKNKKAISFRGTLPPWPPLPLDPAGGFVPRPPSVSQLEICHYITACILSQFVAVIQVINRSFSTLFTSRLAAWVRLWTLCWEIGDRSRSWIILLIRPDPRMDPTRVQLRGTWRARIGLDLEQSTGNGLHSLWSEVGGGGSPTLKLKACKCNGKKTNLQPLRYFP